MRKVLQFRIRDADLIGTYHVPGNGAALYCDHSPVELPPGILLLNSGYLPRAARGDLSAQMGDHLAGVGYPVFRFDMPGLGDSGGELPEDLIPFFQSVQNGEHATWAADLATELHRYFGRRRIILAGNCGGAVTAIYAAGLAGQQVSGLILMEPNFAKFAPDTPTTYPGVRQIMAMRQSMRNWLLASPGSRHFRRMYWRLCWPMQEVFRRMQSSRLPADTNLPLAYRWRRLARAGLPMLILQAGQQTPGPVRFDYLRHLRGHRADRVVSIEIADTTHSFVEGDGKRMVLCHIEQWLRVFFPLQLDVEPQRSCPAS